MWGVIPVVPLSVVVVMIPVAPLVVVVIPVVPLVVVVAAEQDSLDTPETGYWLRWSGM